MNGIPPVGTPIQIVSSSSGMALDTQVPVLAPGVPIVLNSPSGGPSQFWRTMPAGDDGFMIVPVMGSPIPLALGATGGSGGPGAPIVLNPPLGGPSLIWRIVPAGDDVFTILGASSGMALDVQGASPAPGALIIQNPPRPGTSSQLWQLVPTD